MKINKLTGGICSLEQFMQWGYCNKCRIAGKCQLAIEMDEEEKSDNNELSLSEKTKLSDNKRNRETKKIKVWQHKDNIHGNKI